jgi:carbamoyltransferase
LKILGINSAHNSAACILENGKLVAAVAEERFTKIKGCSGFPMNAIASCLEMTGTRADELDAVAVAGSYLPSLPQPTYRKLKNVTGFLIRLAPRKANVYTLARLPFAGSLLSGMKERRVRELSKYFGVDEKKIHGVDHHMCHACSTLFSSGFVSEGNDAIVITVDGSGDNRSSTVSTFTKGKLEIRASTDASASIGVLYSEVTRNLGMRVDEDEYKVMGLAPYAANSKGEEVYRRLSSVVRFDTEELVLKSNVPSIKYDSLIREDYARVRFDFLAYAVQKVVEELLLSMVKTAVSRYSINRVACGGGVFMNVKANMRIAQLPQVEKMFVMPSAGDETNAIGAAYFVHRELFPDVPIEPLRSLYLGPEFSDKEIEQELQKHDFKVEKSRDIDKEVSDLLTENKVVARIQGKMEFGARALGNRSILANPKDYGVVQQINRQIKGRDFWMPFAPVILEGKSNEYLLSPDISKLNADSMVFAFETTKKAQSDLPAALHPYDKTARPQVLSYVANPAYHQIVSGFETRTGIGGLLNTSFNLHGEPIVCSPADALHTIEDSGLRYLAIGNYLVSK